MRNKKIWGAGAILAFVVAGLVLHAMGWKKTTLFTSSAAAGLALAVKLDLAAPDALIRSSSLSKLPADLLRVPLLHDLLSEDFLFYYEHSEGRLGLSGTLRRIAYEHDVNLGDELIRLVLDEPAEVALWRGHKGSLTYFAIAMTRNPLAKLLEPLAKIALKDRQLTLAGEVRVGGDTVQLFALDYAWNRKLLLASHADRVVLFSDPAMLLAPDGQLKEHADAMLNDLLGSDPDKQQRFSRAFGLAERSSGHSIAVKTDFLSFSYQHFFPAFKALRFDFSDKAQDNGQNWASSALLDVDAAPAAGALFDAGALWAALPYQPSACAVVPVDWQSLSRAMNTQTVLHTSADAVAARFKGPAAVCWYAKSRLHTPLLVAQLGQEPGADEMLSSYFNYAIADPTPGGKRSAPVKAARNKAGDLVWQDGAEASPRPTLARSGRLVYFSPDAALVEQALAVAHKRQPAISDSWSGSDTGARTVAVIGAAQLAQLAETEIAASLPKQQDAALRGAADQHLLPKLAAVKKYPPLRLQMQALPQGAGWAALDWQTQ